MRELFNKAMIEKMQTAKYAVNEIQKQVTELELKIKFSTRVNYFIIH
jgi:hypothetical protein